MLKVLFMQALIFLKLQPCKNMLESFASGHARSFCGNVLRWFHGLKDRIGWLEECCSELNVLKGSQRERMCDSVLSHAASAKVSKGDMKEPKGVDTGAVVIGQDSWLIWTQLGVDSEFGQKNRLRVPPPTAGEPVSELNLG